MRSLQDQMFLSVDELPFSLCVRPPEHKNEVFALLIECSYSCISQFLPAFSLVTSGFVGFDGEGCVEKQHSLLRPAAKITRRRNRRTEVTVDLLIYIRERRGYLHAFGHRERESHGLSGLVIGVLTDDDDTHLVKGTRVKGVKNKTSRRKTAAGLILGTHILSEEFEIGFVKLRLQYALPRWFYSDVH